jgi:hypothetical protein
MFFVTFSYTKRLWDHFIKALHTLHALRLKFSNKIKELHFFHIATLIRNDLVTCAEYYDHKTSFSHKLMTKDHYLFGHIFYFIFVSEFQNHESEHDHEFLWIKYAPMYRVHTNEKIEWFLNMYISCDVLLLLPNPLQNAQ